MAPSGPTALGIDVGMSGTRAALVSAEGRVLSRGDCRRELSSWRDARSLARSWRREVVEATGRAFEGTPSRDLSALAVCGLGPSAILVDESLDIVAGPLLFFEPRDEKASRPAMQAGALPPEHVLPKLLHLEEEDPSLVSSTAFVLDTTGYLVAYLTGRPVMDVLTAADYLWGDLHAPVTVPTPRSPDAIAGGLCLEAAESLHLEAGVPVAVGTYDSYADLLAMGLSSPGDAGLLLGSTFVAAALAASDGAAPPQGTLEGAGSDGLRYLEWPFGSCQLIGGWTSSAGTTLEWSRAAFGFTADEETTAWRLPPGSGGLVLLPYLAGERTPVWDAASSGALVGLRLETSRPELCRAMLDGVVLAARQICRLVSIEASPARWRVGGGGTRHTAWLQAMADATGYELEVVDASGGVGAALLAFRSIGVEVHLEPTEVVTPEQETTRLYDQLATVYETLYPSLKEAMHLLACLRAQPA